MEQGTIWRLDEDRLKYKVVAGRLRKINALLLFVIVALLVSSMALLVNWQEARQLRFENALLQSEIRHWQEAAVPALNARGWKVTKEELDVLDPVMLQIALNPCINKDGSWIESDECHSATPPPYNPNKIPIKIVLAR